MCAQFRIGISLFILLINQGSFAASQSSPQANCQSFLTINTRDLPDLRSAYIDIPDSLLSILRSFRLNPDDLINQIEGALWPPYPIGPSAPNRFVLFFSARPNEWITHRLEFVYSERQHSARIIYVSPFTRTRDEGLVERIEKSLPLHKWNFRITRRALNMAVIHLVSAEDIEAALLHPLAPAVRKIENQNAWWQIGYDEQGRAINLNYESDGRSAPLIQTITLANPDTMRMYLTASGTRSDEREQTLLPIQRGPHLNLEFRFGPGITHKIANKHHLTREEVREAIERSQGFAIDPIETGRGQPRFQIVSRLQNKKVIKVIVAEDSPRKYVIVSAYDVDLPRMQLYLQASRQLNH